jgi:hypothetical protein
MRLTAGSLAVTVVIVLGVTAFWPDSHPLSIPVTPRAVAQATAATSTSLAEPTVEDNNAATERKLAKRIPAQFEDSPLNDVDNVIRKPKLEEGGVNLDMPVNLHLKQIRAEMLLDLLFSDAGLTYTVRDGIVIISTEDDQDVALEIRIYNVRDLVTMDAEKAKILRESLPSPRATNHAGFGGFGGGGGGFFQVATGVPVVKPAASTEVPAAAQPSGTGGGQSGSSTGLGRRRPPGPVPAGDGKLVEYFEPLIELIRATIDPDTWDETGGSGSAMQFDDGLLVVNQSPRVHRKISHLLEKLRELRSNHATPQVPTKAKR